MREGTADSTRLHLRQFSQDGFSQDGFSQDSFSQDSAGSSSRMVAERERRMERKSLLRRS